MRKMDPAYPNQPTNQLTDASFNRPSTAFPQSAPSSQPKTQNEQSANSAAKPKKAWTLILAWIAFIVAALLFLALGPGSFIVAAITSPYSWVVDLGWVPKIHEVLTFAAPVILILAGVSVFFTYRKFPTRMRTVIILLSSVIIGLPITILSLNGVIPMTKMIYAIIAAIMTMVPIMLLVILKVRDKNKTLSVSPNTANKKATMIVLVIILAVIGVELGFALFQLPAPI